MDEFIKIDLNGPKLLTITHKAVQNGLPIPSLPLTLTIKRIKIGQNSFPMLKVDSDSLPLFMNPIGPGSEFEILDPEGHTLYTWQLQDDGRSTQPEPQVTSTPDEPIANRSNAQVHAVDSASEADEPQPTSAPSKPTRSRKSLRLLEKEGPKEKPSLLKEEREFLSVVLSKLYAQMCTLFRFLFWEPVDPEEMDLPTYRHIITRPMALRDMYYKLQEQNYSFTQAFRDDFELIIRNAELFNGRNHPVTLMSHRVEEAFIALMDGGSECPKLECGERECRDCRKLGKQNRAGKGEKRPVAAEMSRSDHVAKRKAFRMGSGKQDKHLEAVGLWDW